MKRHGQTCDESRNVSCDLARYNSIPNSFLSSFADLHDDGMSRMPRISNESSNLNVMLPAMFCAGTSHTVAASISNSLLQIEMDELRRPMMEDHKQFSVESGNRRLSGQNSRFHEEASPSFAATLKQHPSLAAADFKYEFATSHVHFNSHQQQNLQSSEEKVRSIAGKGIQSPMGKNGNGSMTTSEIMTNSPITIKSNLLRHRSSPASLFSDLTTDAAGIATRHTDQNGSQLSTQLVQSAENEDVVGYSEEAGLTSLSEAAELTVDIGGRCLDGDSISHEGSLMSILEGTSSIRKRARGLDGIQMNVSSPSDLQDGLAEHTTSLTRHMSLPVPLKPNDVPQGDNCLQDSVPCRLRAKRGCATHPRSIAERVRRTRISERMRKLQELVPNMDKQSNTADMLDEAVEYVKFLQRQVQELSQSRARCERLCQLKQNESQPS